MNEHALRAMLEGGGGTAGRLLRTMLWLPGKAYGFLMDLRRRSYQTGLLRSFPSPLPTVSVGNLTAGGSGKTPFTAFLARQLIASGRRPGIILRGYRQPAGGKSDEAELYARLCPGAVVEVGPDRVADALRAREQGADILLMDDGFQHLRLRRDHDIVLIDATSPWGGGNTIPGGLLREPPAALRHAHAVVVTRSDQAATGEVERIMQRIRCLAPRALLTTARHVPVQLTRLDGGVLPLSSLRGQKVVALTGIARPEAFVQTLTDLGAVVADTIARRDHDEFDPAMLGSAVETAGRHGAVLIMTEKDRVKKIFDELATSIKADNNNVIGVDLWIVGVELEVTGAPELLAGIMALAEAKTLSASDGRAE